MQAQIQKWGNSLGVRIPKSIAGKLHLKINTIVNLSIADKHLIITSETSNLDLMLNQITQDNLHHELLNDDGTMGGESW